MVMFAASRKYYKSKRLGHNITEDGREYFSSDPFRILGLVVGINTIFFPIWSLEPASSVISVGAIAPTWSHGCVITQNTRIWRFSMAGGCKDGYNRD